MHVLKTLRKPLSGSISGQSLVVRSPYLAPLVKYCVAEDVVFVLLKRIQGQVLPEYVSRYIALILFSNLLRVLDKSTR